MVADLPNETVPNFAIPWLWRWWQADFSWDGLQHHRPWLPENDGNLQTYIRWLDRDRSDEDLHASGTLINCGLGGLYHVLFIPDEWAQTVAEITAEDLLRRKQDYWQRLFADGGIIESAIGTIAGAHIPTAIERSLIQSFRVSFEWIRFGQPLIGVPHARNRSFTWCQFTQEFSFRNLSLSEKGNHNVRFTWSDIDQVFEVVDDNKLNLLDVNGCKVSGKFVIHGSSIAQLRLENSDAQALSILNSSITDSLTIAHSDIGWLEFINSTFSDHVLFIESSLGESIHWLGCDFKGRVTLSSLNWPSSAIASASASGSRFEGIFEITGHNLPRLQFFQDAEITSKLTLPYLSDKNKRAFFEGELRAPNPDSNPMWDRLRHSQSIESGCRTLRKVAESSGDVHNEQLWHRFELIARKSRGDSTSAEAIFSFLYGFFADYGLSILRPFMALFCCIFLFGFMYAWIGGSSALGQIDVKSIQEGLGFSLNRTFPIGVFADERNPWRENLLGSGGSASHIAVRALATFQTILAAILVYLGVMAIRRKFRIS